MIQMPCPTAHGAVSVQWLNGKRRATAGNNSSYARAAHESRPSRTASVKEWMAHDISPYDLSSLHTAQHTHILDGNSMRLCPPPPRGQGPVLTLTLGRPYYPSFPFSASACQLRLSQPYYPCDPLCVSSGLGTPLRGLSFAQFPAPAPFPLTL